MSTGEGKKPAFDFNAMFNMDPVSKDDLLRGEVYSAFEEINGKMSPMIWALAWREMEKAKGDQVLLSAILNSVVNAAAMFVAASVDEGTFIDDICDKMVQNVRNCFAQREDARQIVASSAPGVGRAMLIEESLPGIRDVVAQVADGLTGTMKGLAVVATELENLKKE